ncbi:MAG TPA: NAD(P)H-dependent oxidoreductase [Thermodesulfovibrionales bacterium]|nr:NAD(P)H-dependent oxidoreductase [Thermodesulfovibrionales bacterium]
MSYLIIYAHPNSGSFNRVIMETITEELRHNGKGVKIRDLYQMEFNPILKPGDFAHMQKGSVAQDVKEEQELIQSAEVMVFVYPLWWAGMPAMLKGYIDRVFTEGFAYKITDNGIAGTLSGKKVFLFTTMGASIADYEESGFFKSMGQITDTGIFSFCGCEVLGHKYFPSVPYVSDSDRKNMLAEVRETVKSRLL